MLHASPGPRSPIHAAGDGDVGSDLDNAFTKARVEHQVAHQHTLSPFACPSSRQLSHASPLSPSSASPMPADAASPASHLRDAK